MYPRKSAFDLYVDDERDRVLQAVVAEGDDGNNGDGYEDNREGDREGDAVTGLGRDDEAIERFLTRKVSLEKMNNNGNYNGPKKPLRSKSALMHYKDSDTHFEYNPNGWLY